MAGKVVAKPNDIAWINRDLDKKEKERMKKQYVEPNTVFDAVEALINTGHKVSLVYDTFASCFAAYAYPTPNNSLNRGMALAARARTAHAALTGLVFRHFDLFEGSWRAGPIVSRMDDDE